MFTTPPLVASANASASVWESAKTSTSFVAVTLPDPSLAATVGAVSAVALEALTATIPIPNVSTLASVESFARAETSMSNAPATPTVPRTGSVVVVPTFPFSAAVVSPFAVASG